MRLGANGLREVSTSDLKEVLRAVHRGTLPCPIDQRGLGQVQLLRLVDNLGHLRGLDKAAVQAVIVAVIAERT